MLIRAAQPADANAISSLLEELGHPLEPARVAERIGAVSGLALYCSYVAEIDGVLVGLITAFASPLIHREAPAGRVSILIVRSTHISAGVGSTLLAHVETFLRNLGCDRIEVASSAHRQAAHGFYRHRGYEQTGIRLSKALAGNRRSP